ncbi:hypothetical protein ABH947_001209 [Bacillus sp. RC206]
MYPTFIFYGVILIILKVKIVVTEKPFVEFD